jgi:hypothetical protein
MTDRLFYAATALALLAVFALDPNFATNLSRVFADGEITLPQLDRWVAGAGSIFLVLGVVALFREWRR